MNASSNPSSGYTFSYDLNQPGPTITCIGYAEQLGMSFQQTTVWIVTNSSGVQTIISASSSVFALSNETLSGGVGPGRTSLTILNVTNGLDGSTITCGIIGTPFQQIATFTVKMYSKCNKFLCKMAKIVPKRSGSCPRG